MSGYETPPAKAPGSSAARRSRKRLATGWLVIAVSVVLAVLAVFALAWIL